MKLISYFETMRHKSNGLIRFLAGGIFPRNGRKKFKSEENNFLKENENHMKNRIEIDRYNERNLWSSKKSFA